MVTSILFCIYEIFTSRLTFHTHTHWFAFYICAFMCISNKQLSRKYDRNFYNNRSQESENDKNFQERSYIELIRCHCFVFFFFLILYPICVLVIFISYSCYYHSDDVVYYLLMLGGRSNTNLFSSPTQSVSLPHTTISVEQSTTGGLDEERQRERKRKSARSFSLSPRFDQQWVGHGSHSLSHTCIHTYMYTHTHRLFTAARAIPVWCIWWEETNECVTGPNQFIMS